MYYRLACYLYEAGKIKDAYLQLEEALDLDFDSYLIIFDIIPALQNDTVVLNHIEQKRNLA